MKNEIVRDYLHSTKFKIKLANFIYRILKVFRVQDLRLIHRRGIAYEVDLAEGIDLSLFLFGNFQSHVADNDLVKFPKDMTAFDIGANIGSVSLFLANKYDKSSIYAFEPTEYAYNKLKRNIEINPKLKNRIKTIQTFISSGDQTCERAETFSSWRIDNIEGNRHPIHLGIAKKATQEQTTIDKFVECNSLSNLHFIKIDTDGHELEILRGARKTLNNFRPVIVFEVSTYLLGENGQSFHDFENLLYPMGYTLLDAKSSKCMTSLNISSIVPQAGSVDVLALPVELDSQ